MKFILVKFAVLVALAAAAGSHAATVTMTLMPGTDTWVQGIYFKAGSNLDLDTGSFQPVKGTLGSQGYVSRGIVWGPNTVVELNEKLEVMKGTAMGGSSYSMAIKPNSQVIFHPTGVPISVQLGAETRFNGGHRAANDSQVMTYAAGSIRAARVMDDFLYNVPGTTATFQFAADDVIFYPSPILSNPMTAGPVRQAKLKANHINPRTLDNIVAGTVVTLDARGEIIRLFGENIPIQHRRITLPVTSTIEIMTDGSFSAFAITPFIVAGKTYPAFQKVFFGIDGVVIGVKPP